MIFTKDLEDVDFDLYVGRTINETCNKLSKIEDGEYKDEMIKWLTAHNFLDIDVCTAHLGKKFEESAKKNDITIVECDEITIVKMIDTKLTIKFLNECGKAGYSIVSLGKKTDLIPHTLTWPFQHNKSAFGNKIECDWPPIWGVAKKFGCRSCGGSHQYQINDLDVVRGVYKL